MTGFTDADNRWSLADTHASVELAQILYLQGLHAVCAASDQQQVFDLCDKLEKLTPIQYNRSQEQVRFQQFSTPLRLAWIAARATGLSNTNLTLEPSAGTGMLAFWAQQSGSKLALNEIHILRRDALHALFPDSKVSMHDAELIDQLRDPSVLPDTILINPPFSVGLERGEDGRTGARHLRAALARLSLGGRAVAIMPEWFDVDAFLARSRMPLALRVSTYQCTAPSRAQERQLQPASSFDKVDGGSAPVTAHVKLARSPLTFRRVWIFPYEFRSRMRPSRPWINSSVFCFYGTSRTTAKLAKTANSFPALCCARANVHSIWSSVK